MYTGSLPHTLPLSLHLGTTASHSESHVAGASFPSGHLVKMLLYTECTAFSGIIRVCIYLDACISAVDPQLTTPGTTAGVTDPKNI